MQGSSQTALYTKKRYWPYSIRNWRLEVLQCNISVNCSELVHTRAFDHLYLIIWCVLLRGWKDNGEEACFHRNKGLIATVIWARDFKCSYDTYLAIATNAARSKAGVRRMSCDQSSVSKHPKYSWHFWHQFAAAEKNATVAKYHQNNAYSFNIFLKDSPILSWLLYIVYRFKKINL